MFVSVGEKIRYFDSIDETKEISKENAEKIIKHMKNIPTGLGEQEFIEAVERGEMRGESKNPIFKVADRCVEEDAWRVWEEENR